MFHINRIIVELINFLKKATTLTLMWYTDSFEKLNLEFTYSANNSTYFIFIIMIEYDQNIKYNARYIQHLTIDVSNKNYHLQI